MTNFDMNRYDVKSILESNTLPIGGGAAKRLKEAQALESSRKREEMMALSSTFQYGSSGSTSSASNNRLQSYPLLQPHHTTSLIDMAPHLSLQNDISHHYSHHHHQDPSLIHQNYIQTQLQLHQQQTGTTSYQFYNNGYNSNTSTIQNHPGFLQGFMENMGTTSSVMDNSGNSGGSYSVGYNLGMASTSAVVSGNAEELALVKVDYDMPSGGYGAWSGSGSGSGNGSNPGVFTMWND